MTISEHNKIEAERQEQEMTDITLKPCPFCRKKFEQLPDAFVRIEHRRNCFIGGTEYISLTRAGRQFIKNWNTRAGEKE